MTTIFPPFSTFAGGSLYVKEGIFAVAVYVKISSRFLLRFRCLRKKSTPKPFSGMSKEEKYGFMVIDRS